jgi:hypothetical protein
MLPLHIAIGDHNSLFMLRTICTTGSLEPVPMEKIPCLFDQVAARGKKELEKGKPMKVQLEESYSFGRKDDDKPVDAEPSEQVKQGYLGIVFEGGDDYARCDLAFGLEAGARGHVAAVIQAIATQRALPPKALAFLPGATDKITPAPGSRLFSYDSNGKTCFTLEKCAQGYRQNSEPRSRRQGPEASLVGPIEAGASAKVGRSRRILLQ